jgi:hypothetical protein
MVGDFDDIRSVLINAASLATTLDWQERLTAAAHRVDSLKAKVEKLEEEKSDAVARCRELEAQIATDSIADEFVDYLGILFKSSEIKKRNAVPYCPKCRLPMASPMRHMSFSCSHCRLHASFGEEEIPGIISELLGGLPKERLDEMKEKILTLVAGGMIAEHDIAKAIEKNVNMIRYHVEDQSMRELISRTDTSLVNLIELTPVGRAYLATHGLFRW